VWVIWHAARTVIVKDKLSQARAWFHERQLPRVVTLTDFDPQGVRFEVASLVERHRVVHHGDETDYTRAMLAALRADDVLFDIGANVGLVCLHAATKCRTVAFEPDPGFAARLATNIALNPERDVDVVNVAVSDRDGIVTLYTSGATGNSPSLVRQRGELQAVEVEGRSLDSLLAEASLPDPTVLKLDIEGAEILALRGAAQLLQSERRPRALFIEVHDALLPAFGSSGEEVLRLVRDAGYAQETYHAPRAEQRHLILERG
jgi:FkbM family methyltransferase